MVGLLTDDAPEVVEGSFVDESLKAHQTDRLYRVRLRTGRAAYVYCLVEHKSWPDRRVPLQLLRYLTRIYTSLPTERESGLLPLVVPLIVYNGGEPWRVASNFAALVDAPAESRGFVPDFRYVLVDLGSIPDERLPRQADLRAGLLGMKYATRPAEQRARLVEVVVAVKSGTVPGLRRATLSYIITTYRAVPREVMVETMKMELPEEWIEAMKVVDQILLEKEKEWARRFRNGKIPVTENVQRFRTLVEEAKAQDMLLKLLAQRFGPVPESVVAQVNEAPLETLDLWFTRVLTAQSLEEVLEESEH